MLGENYTKQGRSGLTYDLINRMGCESHVPFRSRTKTCSRPEDCVLELVVSQNLCVFLELRFRMPISRWAEGIRDQNQKAKTKTKKELVSVDLFDVMVFSLFLVVLFLLGVLVLVCVCACVLFVWAFCFLGCLVQEPLSRRAGLKVCPWISSLLG